MPYTIDPIEFIREQESRVVKYYSTNKLKLSGFEGRQDFIDWYFQMSLRFLMLSLLINLLSLYFRFKFPP